jgi:hypothetical protein
MNQRLSDLQKITEKTIKKTERKAKIQKITLTIKKVAFCIMLVSIGISYTVNYYEGKLFINDYLNAIDNATRIIENRYGDVVTEKEAATLEQPASVEEKTPETPLQGSVEQIIEETAKQHGFNDVELLKRIAKCESSLNPQAKNENSTALGTFQYLSGTWQEGCKKTGNTDWTLDDRMDVEKATRMAIWHISTGHLSKWNASASCWNS